MPKRHVGHSMGIEIVILGFLLVGLALLHVLYQLVRRGFTGAAFGADVLRSSDKIRHSSDWLTGGHVRVHRLNANGRPLVGIRVVSTSWFVWEEVFVKLTADDAQRLAQAIEDAADA